MSHKFLWRVFVLALGHWSQSVFLFKIPILQSFSEQNFQKLPHFANYFCSKVILLNLLHNSCSGLNKEQKIRGMDFSGPVTTQAKPALVNNKQQFEDKIQYMPVHRRVATNIYLTAL